jgi:hypothetical protein
VFYGELYLICTIMIPQLPTSRHVKDHNQLKDSSHPSNKVSFLRVGKWSKLPINVPYTRARSIYHLSTTHPNLEQTKHVKHDDNFILLTQQTLNHPTFDQPPPILTDLKYLYVRTYIYHRATHFTVFLLGSIM